MEYNEQNVSVFRKNNEFLALLGHFYSSHKEILNFYDVSKHVQSCFEVGASDVSLLFISVPVSPSYPPFFFFFSINDAQWFEDEG